MRLKSRECLADIANAIGLKTAVEIGTHQAVFAHSFMKRFRGVITLVDPWMSYEDGKDAFYPSIDHTSRSRSKDMEIAVGIMSEFSGRVDFMQMTSDEASHSFEDSSIGLVYIDALHEYGDVIRDINTWFPKVASGGIIAGHDFSYLLPGVICAVDEFRKSSGLEINLTCDEMPSWWAIKQ